MTHRLPQLLLQPLPRPPRHLGHPLQGQKGESQGTGEASITLSACASPSAHLRHRAPHQEPQPRQERQAHQGHREHRERQERQERQERRQCQERQHQLLQATRGKLDLIAATVERWDLVCSRHHAAARREHPAALSQERCTGRDWSRVSQVAPARMVNLLL